MKMINEIHGVIAAAVTPLKADSTLELDHIELLIEFLHRRGCHGALFFGTTGEGPSFSFMERHALLKEVIKVRNSIPDFIVLAGTGTPSLEETIRITKDAFDTGVDGVVTLPPYYFHSISDDGLYDWYSIVIERSVPSDGKIFGYHIPKVSGVPISLELLSRLKDKFPSRFAGIKDSSGDAGHMLALHDRFGSDLRIFTGNDKLFSKALQHNAVGCITALANIASPFAREIYNLFLQGKESSAIQKNLDHAREILDFYPPAAPYLKAMYAEIFNLPQWGLKPPLIAMDEESVKEAVRAIDSMIGLETLTADNQTTNV